MTKDQLTKEIEASLKIRVAVGQAIRDLGEIPSGHLYARVMSYLSLETYQAVIADLVAADLVHESGHLLTWVGPPAP